MSAIKQYVEKNVYDSAKDRIKHIVQAYDDFCIGFSGGKDSLTCVLLTKEVFDELGLKDRKIKIYFYDEEFVYPETIATIQRVFSLPWVQPYYFTLQMDSDIILPDGQTKSIVFWDIGRDWLREKPEVNITDNTQVYDLYDAEIVMRKFIFPNPGLKLCKIMGLRGEESLTRTLKVLNNWRKGDKAFIQKTKIANINMAIPIYDWKLNDIFFYLKNQNVVPINELYWKELLTKRALRVDTPLHSKNRSGLDKIKRINPDFWEKILKIFPDIDTSAKYIDSLKVRKDYNFIISKYGLTIKGIDKFIEENFRDQYQKDLARYRVDNYVTSYILNGKYDTFHMTKEQCVRRLFLEILKGNLDKRVMMGSIKR